MATISQLLKRLLFTKQRCATSWKVEAGLTLSFAHASSLTICSTEEDEGKRENAISWNRWSDDKSLSGRMDDGDEILSDWVGGSRQSPPHSSEYFKKLDSLCKSGEVDEANKLLTTMLEKNICPKPHFFNSVIVGYAKAGRCEESLRVCSRMRTFGYRPHITAYNSLISTKFKQGKVMDALDLFDQMQRDRWQPNEVTKSILAFGLCRSGHAEQVRSLIHERLGKCGTVSTSVVNALLNSLVSAGKVDAAQEIGRQIFSGLCLPNVFTYAALIRGYCAQGNVDEAMGLLLEMDKRGCKPNLACYGSLISRLCKMDRFRDAYNLFEEMLEKGIDAEGAFCDLLLSNLSTKGMMVEALRVCNYVADKRILVEDATFHFLLEGLSKADRLGEASEVLEHLVEKGCLANVRHFKQALRVFQRRQTLSAPHGTVPK